MEAESVAVEIDRVSKRFWPPKGSPVDALKRVNLRVASGEFLSVLGPSGCGKSTLLSIVAGLEPATSGEVRIGGARITGPYKPAGVVFQRDLLLEWRNCLDNILIQFEMRGQRPAPYRKRALELLELVGIADFAKRYPRELSGGMRQRVSICRALAHDPDLLLMDEPFGALDAITREQLNDDLARLCAETGKTVIFITHSISEAVFLGHRVIVMSPRPGRIIKELKVDLPAVRTADVRAMPEFTAYSTELRQALFNEGILR
jgi:NitT/TauT family transport system ATP-binding protein